MFSKPHVRFFRKKKYSQPVIRIPDELLGTCKVCGKNFIAYKEARFNTEYCNLHWDKTKKTKKIKIKKSSVKPKQETWQSIVKEELNDKTLPYKWKRKLFAELGRKQYENN